MFYWLIRILVLVIGVWILIIAQSQTPPMVAQSAIGGFTIGVVVTNMILRIARPHDEPYDWM